MITHADLTDVPEDKARRIIVAARSIAPCIVNLADDSEQKKDALAILKGIAAEAPAIGSRRVKSQRIGSASVEYWNADSWSAEDRELLRSLCPAAAPTGTPRGSFPGSGALERVWPEGTYS